jgi:osmoprotectant transport system permease protein
VGASEGEPLMSALQDAWEFLTTGANWTGDTGILQRTWEHLQYSFVALVIAAVIAIPLGLLIGHTRRATFLTISLTGAARAVPTIGLLILLYKVQPLKAWPAIVVLVVLAVPPMLANTYAGVVSVDPATRDAASGVGMTAPQVVLRVEAPLGLPLILAGIRSATSQVIATATVAAYIGLGGLGRFIIDGYASQDYGQVYGGAVVVAVLALLFEGVFALLQRAVSLDQRMARAGRPTTVVRDVTIEPAGGVTV